MPGHTIVLIPGDGIGPEVTSAARRVIDAAAAPTGLQLAWELLPAGEAAIKTDGDTLPEKTLDAKTLRPQILAQSFTKIKFPINSVSGSLRILQRANSR